MSKVAFFGVKGNIHVGLYTQLINQYSREFSASILSFGKWNFYKKLNKVSIFHGITLSRNYKLYFLAKLMGVKTIHHWMGSDVQYALTSKDGYRRAKFTNLFIDLHLASSPDLVKELKTIGIKAHFVPVVPLFETPIVKPIPEKFTILAYLPDNRHRFYGSEYIHKLADDFPNIEFNIIAGEGGQYSFKNNVHYLGYQNEMSDIYSNSNVLIRMVEHDGFSLCVQEALAHGRHVIYSYKSDYCNFASKYSEVKGHIESLISNPSINMEGHNFIKREFNPQKISKTVEYFYNQILCS